MKMFKKLMAVVLAGVMALAVLTGCGSALNEKEMIRIMNDGLKTTSSGTVKEYKADNGVTAKAKAVAKIVAEKAKKEADIKDVLMNNEDVDKAVVGENDDAFYVLSYVKSISFSSNYYKDHKNMMNVEAIGEHSVIVNAAADYQVVKDATVLVGFADVKLDDGVYTIIVMKAPTEKVA